jgi:hypothetical protein
MPVRTDEEEWQALWRGICELSSYYPEGIVFIGGVAVYLHVHGDKDPSVWVEFSHDGDFFISMRDFADLRDMEEVTTNRRLNKHQIIKEGIDFDIYVEHRNGLRIPYADIAAASSVIEEVRVAAAEHLLLLKLDAFHDRRASAKGRKDERDLIRIAHVLHRRVRVGLLEPFVNEQDVDLLAGVLRASAEFHKFGKSPRDVRIVRAEFSSVLDVVKKAMR